MAEEKHLSAATKARIAEHWPAILDAVALNEKTVYAAARDIAGVGVRAIQRYAHLVPGARDELDQALRDGSEMMVAGLDEMITTEPDARRARVRAEFAYKVAASRDPDRFGDRKRLDMTVKTLDLTRIISDANARLAAQRAPVTIEHATGEVLAPGLDEMTRAALAAVL